jgi:hypothetical protein
MKNITAGRAFASAALCFAMLFAACSGGGDSPDPKSLTVSVAAGGVPTADGMKATVNWDNNDANIRELGLSFSVPVGYRGKTYTASVAGSTMGLPLKITLSAADGNDCITQTDLDNLKGAITAGLPAGTVIDFSNTIPLDDNNQYGTTLAEDADGNGILDAEEGVIPVITRATILGITPEITRAIILGQSPIPSATALLPIPLRKA